MGKKGRENSPSRTYYVDITGKGEDFGDMIELEEAKGLGCAPICRFRVCT